MEKPLVSICSITYNHAPFIRQCLDGMLMQKTDFPFEIIINDDCSTDGTTEIIKEYAEKYPAIVKPIFHKENQYQKGIRGMFQRFVFPKAQGKYIALCEGDDYWTDPLKLQKQVDFLESHPDYSLCFHNAVVHYEGGNKGDHLFANFDTGTFGRKELTDRWLAPTASFVFRKTVLETELYDRVRKSDKLVYGDLPLIITASYYGKIKGQKDAASVYRKHDGGIMSTYGSLSYKLCLHYVEMERIFRADFVPMMKSRIGKYAAIAISQIRKKQLKNGFLLWRTAFRYAPCQSLKESVLYYVNGIKYRTVRSKKN